MSEEATEPKMSDHLEALRTRLAGNVPREEFDALSEATEMVKKLERAAVEKSPGEQQAAMTQFMVKLMQQS
ncbi:MAG: hypothetical protein RIG84_17785 [Roseovarius sp.]